MSDPARGEDIQAAFKAQAAAFAGGVGSQLHLSETFRWSAPPGVPERSFESAMLFGGLEGQGAYMTLVRWHPGFMSAPHTYLTDRLCVVLSGVWWIGDGERFDLAACRPAPAGSFVLRPAETPHFDGVVADGAEPAVVAISGLAPIGLKFTDPALPPLVRL